MCIRDRSDRGKVRWCHDERYCERVVELFILREREREIILFDVVRNYEELLEKINRERISNSVDLPCKIDIDDVTVRMTLHTPMYQKLI